MQSSSGTLISTSRYFVLLAVLAPFCALPTFGCADADVTGSDSDTDGDSDVDSDSDTDSDSDGDTDTDTDTGSDTSVCGDGQATGDEDCDHIGESETCDDDCTAVECGDGNLNETAGEYCDDGGESATCDTDCTVAECQDGVTNATAGEDCDESGETATCDDDCTVVECGDGNLNETAGEECDDSNLTDGDGCDQNCMAECVTTSVTTTMAAGNSFEGNMFDIIASQDLVIDSFDVNIAASSATVEVYYRDGSYSGYTNSSTGWTLLGSAAVTGNGSGVGTPLNLTLDHQIPSGSTHGFYVTTTGATMYYTNSTSSTTGTGITVTSGYGGEYPFNLDNSGRQWNGTVHYDYCN